MLVGLILLTVALNAAAQIFLRIGAQAGSDLRSWRGALSMAVEPAILGGLALYGMSVLLWIWVLGRVEVSFAYPFLGFGFVLVALAGWMWLGEPLGARKLLATGLIVAGVMLLAGEGRT